MQAQKTRLKGYIVAVKDGDETTETHYVVKPNGAVLFRGRLRKRKIKHVKPIADARY